MKKETIKKINKGIIIGASIAIYWLIIVVIYALTSFLTKAWNITWIIWLIAFVVFLIVGLIYYSAKKNNLVRKHSFFFTIIGIIFLFTGGYLLVSFLVEPSIWHISWLIYVAMVIAILVDTIVFAARKNKRLQLDETKDKSID